MHADRSVILSPFSNSDIRDWPIRSYAALIGILLNEAPDDLVFRIIGTPSQLLLGDEIVRHLDAGRVFNDCGRYPWPEVERALREAQCVIGNNSGIVHLAARYGVPTVCVFGGSHQRAEWRPIGPNVVLVSRAIWCSPCHLMRLAECHYDKACLREIAPLEVAEVVSALLSAPAPPQRGAAGERG